MRKSVRVADERMAVSKEVEAFPDYRARHLRSLSPEKHYAECISREKTLRNPNLDLYAEYLLYGGKLFHDAPVGRLKGFRAAENAKHPFQVIAAPTDLLTVSRAEWRNRKLLSLLSKPQDVEFRWILIARWLKQERVCQPQDFLPAGVRTQLIQKFMKANPLSPTDLVYRSLIQNWKTYFDRINEELLTRKHLHRRREDVIQLGFDSGAVSIMARKKSWLEAVCEWLDSRGKGNARTLRNSYSRLHGHSRKRSVSF